MITKRNTKSWKGVNKTTETTKRKWLHPWITISLIRYISISGHNIKYVPIWTVDLRQSTQTATTNTGWRDIHWKNSVFPQKWNQTGLYIHCRRRCWCLLATFLSTATRAATKSILGSILSSLLSPSLYLKLISQTNIYSGLTVASKKQGMDSEKSAERRSECGIWTQHIIDW